MKGCMWARGSWFRRWEGSAAVVSCNSESKFAKAYSDGVGVSMANGTPLEKWLGLTIG